ncbi:MAG: acyl-CoA synthetase FdrA [Coriobacteriales bacterium]|jgi:FdrA protein|nr:acyl-CoA synthetase FdrA [Coriobacteriales bacterium]
MLTTIIRKNSYQDSITLMLLTNSIAEMDGINKVSIMMGTPANKDILAASGLGTPELAQAGANDIAIVMDSEREGIADEVLTNVDAFLARQGEQAQAQTEQTARSWEQALDQVPNANLVLLSIPGRYAEGEAERALDEGKHVFIFSDNVPLEAEVRLKEKAAAAGLLVMGPDCGTALIGGIPLAFANVVPRGTIGIVGASGTGIQEASCQIARLGAGVSHAIGTGGRDISQGVAARTMKMGIAALEADRDTDCILIVSKPPAPAVQAELLALLRASHKPVVVHFLGKTVTAHEPGLYFAHTLEEAAQLAVALSRGETPDVTQYAPEALALNGTDVADAACAVAAQDAEGVRSSAAAKAQGILGLYTGGTLAGEAAVMLEQALGAVGDHSSHTDGFMLNRDGHVIIDLGDDVYTQGKPHPMIAPLNRVEFIRRIADNTEVGVVLLDFVLGYGAHDDMAGETIPAIREVQAAARAAGRDLHFVATICGTEGDPQGFAAQKRALEEAGVLVALSNASAVATALALIGLAVHYEPCAVRATSESAAGAVASGGDPVLSASVSAVAQPVRLLLDEGPRIINVGLRSFTRPLVERGITHVQFDWQPLAGGDVRLQRVLTFLNRYSSETEARS